MRIHRRASAILIDVIEIKQENNLESWTPAKSHILFHLVISGKTREQWCQFARHRKHQGEQHKGRVQMNARRDENA